MVVKNDIRYRIDTLLRMASITSDVNKRNEYLLTVEELLCCEDTTKTAFVEFPFGDEEKMKEIKIFIDDYGESNIIGNINSVVYDAYTNFCKDEPVSRLSFSKYLKKCTGIYPIQKKINGKNCRVYVR